MGAGVIYGHLADSAKLVLRGPKSVQMTDEFWGEPNLSLHCKSNPIIYGMMHSRTIYANLCDIEQKVGILREASWDARAAWTSVKTDVRGGKPLSMPYPILSVRYVWVDIGWLQSTLDSLKDQKVPLGGQGDTDASQAYTLGLERPDRTSIEVCWEPDTSGDFETLTARWESIWQQMSSFLECGEPLTPEEYWPLGAVPVYSQTPAQSASCDQ